MGCRKLSTVVYFKTLLAAKELTDQLLTGSDLIVVFMC